jgi:antitoxin ParD1/3/4
MTSSSERPPRVVEHGKQVDIRIGHSVTARRRAEQGQMNDAGGSQFRFMIAQHLDDLIPVHDVHFAHTLSPSQGPCEMNDLDRHDALGNANQSRPVFLSIVISSYRCYAVQRPRPEERAMTTITISLPESLRTFIDQQLATKGYGNVSEYFRSLLREAQKREEEARFEALLLEGLTSGGDDIPLTGQFWKDLKAEAIVVAKKHQAKKKRP